MATSKAVRKRKGISKPSADLQRLLDGIEAFQESAVAQVLEDGIWDDLDAATEHLGYAADELQRAGL